MKELSYAAMFYRAGQRWCRWHRIRVFGLRCFYFPEEPGGTP